MQLFKKIINGLTFVALLLTILIGVAYLQNSNIPFFIDNIYLYFMGAILGIPCVGYLLVMLSDKKAMYKSLILLIGYLVSMIIFAPIVLYFLKGMTDVFATDDLQIYVGILLVINILCNTIKGMFK